MALNIVRTVAELRAVVREWRADGQSVGLVPTMGALHEGHLSLVQAAKGRCGRVVATLFVNPKQFNNPDDLKLYPRTEEDDAAKLSGAGVDLLYAPDVEEMYPAGFATTISVAGVSEGLCGAHRPGHFDGVATVVSKLFLQSGADMGFFGEKDFQQLAVIRRMVLDLDMPIEIVGVPTVRDADGLALSSRNQRLSEAGRAVAPALARELTTAARSIEARGDVRTVLDEAVTAMRSSGFETVEYLELRDAESLEPMTIVDRPGRLLAAVWIDGVRLIDNVAVLPPIARY